MIRDAAHAVRQAGMFGDHQPDLRNLIYIETREMDEADDDTILEESQRTDDDGVSILTSDSGDDSFWHSKLDYLLCCGKSKGASKAAMVPRCRCGYQFKDNAIYCGQCGAKREIESSPVEVLRKRLEVTRGEQQETRERLQEAQEAFEVANKLLKDQVQEELRITEVLDRSQAHGPVGPPPPGPSWLRFVEGSRFTYLSSAVIMLNVLLLIYETSHHNVEGRVLWFNRVIMLFYTAELVMKMMLWQELFLCGPCSLVLWHVLDLVIVVSGFLDIFIMPMFFAHNNNMKFLSFLRALRLARLVKLIHNFFMADTSWAENEPFQIFIMCIIALSSLVMGLECDFPSITEFLSMFYWEHIILVIFTFEVCVRLKHEGLSFFCEERDWMWNWLDFVVVAGGVVDQWLLPGIRVFAYMVTGHSSHYDSNIGPFMSILRMARLLRVLRLVRLVRRVPQLFNLLTGIAQAMAGMVWVLVLTIVVLYFFALLAVKLFRDGLVFGGKEHVPEGVHDVFNSVPDSIFVLFTVMDGHKSILDPLLDALPLTKGVFMLFVMISEWAMLSILTAVVSEKMIAVTEGSKEADAAAEMRFQQYEKANELDQLFGRMDLNNDGTINLQEFDQMLEDEEKRSALCQATNLTVLDLRLMFNILERRGLVTRKEFIDACGAETRAVNERSLMKLEKRLAGVEEKISTTVVCVEDAGLQHCNGVYVESGIHHMKPIYKKMDNTSCLIYFDFYWKMSDSGDTESWKYCMKSKGDNRTHLNSAEWRSFDESAGYPPKVKWESHHVLDKRIQYLESIVLETHRDIRKLMSRIQGRGEPPAFLPGRGCGKGGPKGGKLGVSPRW